ncbi:helix-turn-helix transcriptional regulator [Pelomonas sp. CA6]|uniref:helix-turn-helix transcriptional regulator n=1 Tax=Pelomonas sp. CA6 TaxID=2907999 RepID=UPI001F4BE92E|nr:substrate-binding domain-containing protein [Pelomonas sp. CA6]MCH7343946.1 helix-turn-helix transcriptional regulator [Pelomonas sp. CA6]
MKQVSIRPHWTIQDPDGPALPARLIELLVQVHERGSLLLAAKALGLSYRHAWDLVRQGEQCFQSQLLHMARGKGSTLTELGEKIAWADRRIQARLKPVLDSLASELAGELQRTLSASAPALRIQASHGFAIERLIERLQQDGLRLEFGYASSAAALAALHEGDCDAAGLHIPLGSMQTHALEHYARWLDESLDLQVIDIATRRQGLMVRAGNPKELFALADLARPQVRFINRQVGSGTRLLLEGLLKQQGVAPERIVGFEQGEYTHAAVAAYVASGMADVGFGLEPPARQFKLDFVPIASERYFLLCRGELGRSAQMQTVLAALRDPALRALLNTLPGYDASHSGRLTPLHEAFGERPPQPAPHSDPARTQGARD